MAHNTQHRRGIPDRTFSPGTFQPFPFDLSLQDLEGLPESLFFSDPNFFGSQVSPAKQRFFRGAFPDIENQFLGGIGAQARAGNPSPDVSFGSFLQDFDPSAFFEEQNPGTRNTSRFNPRTRRLFGF